MTLTDAYAVLKSGTLWSSTAKCKGYAVQNPGEAAKIDAYVAALAAGQTPAPPVLATATGRGLVGMLAALATAPTPTPTPDPIPSPAPTSTPPAWGLQTHYPFGGVWGTPDEITASVKAAGARLIRDDIPWAWSMGGGPTSYNPAWADAVLGPAHANGWKVVAQAGFAPPWANGYAKDSNGTYDDKVAPQPAYYGSYGAYLRWLLQYAHDHYPGTLAKIDMWNEPNWGFLNETSGGQPLNATAYVDLHAAAYRAAKGIEPAAADLTLLDGVKLIAGSTSGVGDFNGAWNKYGWLRPVIAAAKAKYGADGMKAGRWLDEWGCHPYQYNSTSDTAAHMLGDPDGSWRRMWDSDSTGYGTLMKQLTDAGYQGPLNATEWGVPSKPYPSGNNTYNGASEAEQALLFAEGYTQWKAYGRAGVLIWYANFDTGSADLGDDQKHFGAFRDAANGRSAKPVVVQMKAASSL